MALDQARWNASAGVRCEFLLVNPPSPQSPAQGRDFAVVDPKSGNVAGQVAALAQLLKVNGPRGTTPMTQRLKELRQRLLREVSDGRRIMLSIVTDGLPTSPANGNCTLRDKQDFVEELRAFASTFNVFIVIRLATDDDETVDYYNKIDEEVELPLDILDDLQGEAKEVYDSQNGWFAYTPMIHRIREGGTMEKLFDLLDERPFTTVEISAFLELLLRGPDDAPFPRTPKELLEVVELAAARAPRVYDGRSGEMVPPVNMKVLKKALGRTAYGRAKALPGHMLRTVRKVFTTH